MMINKAPAPAPALMMSKLFFVSVLLASLAVVKAERIRHHPHKKVDRLANEHAIDVARPSDHQMEETQKDGKETIDRISRRTADPLPDTASTASTPLKRSVSPDVSRPDPSPIAADDVPPETAEEASVDIGVLEAAKDKEVAGTGRRLSTCPTGGNYVDCVDGYEAGSGNAITCYQACNNGAECCTNYNSCSKATACIEKNSNPPNCDGTKACYEVGYKGANPPIISGGSCSGDDACGYVGFSGTVGAITNSCNGNSACFGLASFFGGVGDISNSCNGASACEFVASSSGGVGDISDSCNISDCCTSHCKFGDNPTIIGIACGLDIVSIATNTCPTSAPSSAPSGEPSTSSAPSSAPSDAPSSAPSGAPSSAPSVTPSTSSAPSFPPQGKSGKMAKSSKSGKVAAKSSKSPTTSKSSKSGKMAKAF
mmetsp:Transcript_11667/g.27578  ORF Transcript_11667/g.27578 Transcript_11667/m.27578 type:complete len:426 (+) Transcript_11667:315-1592(+)